MNEIRFDIQAGEFGDVVVPYIDARSLISILRDIELPFAEAEGHPDTAGNYIGIPKSVVNPSSGHLTGSSNRQYSCSGKAILLVCECGEAGCWPFEVRITKADRTIEWSDFEQPHRSEWKYDALGTLTFDRTEYENAIAALAR